MKSSKHSKKVINPKKTKQLFTVSVIMLLASITILIYAAVYYRDHLAVKITAQPQKPIAVNQPISMGVVDMHTSNVQTSSGNPPFVAPNGQQYVFLTFNVKNRSDKPIQVLPSTDTYVKDSHGTVYYSSPYALKEPLRAGQLLPGETIRGQVSFLVPKQSTLKFFVDAGWSGGVIPFYLN